MWAQASTSSPALPAVQARQTLKRRKVQRLADEGSRGVVMLGDGLIDKTTLDHKQVIQEQAFRHMVMVDVKLRHSFPRSFNFWRFLEALSCS